jgi:acetyl esterase/lipase
MTDRIVSAVQPRPVGSSSAAVDTMPLLVTAARRGRRSRRRTREWKLVGAIIMTFLTCGPTLAQAPAPAPLELAVAQDANAIPLRPAVAGPSEQWMQLPGQGRWVRNVIDASLTPYLPEPNEAGGAAVVVMPGGAFRFLSIDSEGVQVARWLAAHGVAAFLLKYRTVPMPRDTPTFLTELGRTLGALSTRRDAIAVTPEAVADAQAAIRLVRTHAAQFHVDPNKIGLMGFSAGAMTTLAVALGTGSTDRPDFVAPIYGQMDAVIVPKDAPPLFTAIALDDGFFATGKPLGLIQSWRDAGVPIEVHLYERGGHGFGLPGTSMASRLWLEEFYAWLEDRKIVTPGKPGGR